MKANAVIGPTPGTLIINRHAIALRRDSSLSVSSSLTGYASIDTRASSNALMLTCIHKVEIMVGGFLRHRGPEEITLAEIAALVGRSQSRLEAVSIPSARGLQAEAGAEVDDRVDELGAFAAELERGHIAAIDLELVELQFAQVVEAGIAGPEIVERDPDPDALQRR